MPHQPPNPPFANPLPVPPSVAQIEAERQDYIADRRALLLAHGGTIKAATPQDRADSVPWLLLAVLALATAYAVGQRNTEVRIAGMTAPLEARIATVEAQNTSLRNRLAAVDGAVEARWEAWKITNATEPKEGQP